MAGYLIFFGIIALCGAIGVWGVVTERNNRDV